MDVKAKQIFDLGGENNDGDTAREPDDHRVRNVFDHDAEFRVSDQDKKHARDKGRDDEAVCAVLLNDPINNDNKSAGRPADLDAASSEGGNEKPGDDRRKKPFFGRETGGNGKRDRQRNRHHPDHESGNGVRGKLLFGIIF